MPNEGTTTVVEPVVEDTAGEHNLEADVGATPEDATTPEAALEPHWQAYIDAAPSSLNTSDEVEAEQGDEGGDETPGDTDNPQLQMDTYGTEAVTDPYTIKTTYNFVNSPYTRVAIIVGGLSLGIFFLFGLYKVFVTARSQPPENPILSDAYAEYPQDYGPEGSPREQELENQLDDSQQRNTYTDQLDEVTTFNQQAQTPNKPQTPTVTQRPAAPPPRLVAAKSPIPLRPLAVPPTPQPRPQVARPTAVSTTRPEPEADPVAQFGSVENVGFYGAPASESYTPVATAPDPAPPSDSTATAQPQFPIEVAQASPTQQPLVQSHSTPPSPPVDGYQPLTEGTSQPLTEGTTISLLSPQPPASPVGTGSPPQTYPAPRTSHLRAQLPTTAISSPAQGNTPSPSAPAPSADSRILTMDSKGKAKLKRAVAWRPNSPDVLNGQSYSLELTKTFKNTAGVEIFPKGSQAIARVTEATRDGLVMMEVTAIKTQNRTIPIPSGAMEVQTKDTNFLEAKLEQKGGTSFGNRLLNGLFRMGAQGIANSTSLINRPLSQSSFSSSNGTVVTQQNPEADLIAGFAEGATSELSEIVKDSAPNQDAVVSSFYKLSKGKSLDLYVLRDISIN
ncbi:hypothetical protein [Acaryochloris marina]|uniref:hypothetical protein n=1 Tax=Acaryochloris marina TaxID=155978 RepID=UPI0021C32D11|nr:hypothetical protein [Acaryochloris marina]BDM83177.1 hypothetical protein AM10699_60380 [Acaryochloris marina MBIC10699]